MGRTLEVLFEQEEAGWWTGYTANYLRVAVRSNTPLENEIRPVHLAGIEAGRLMGVLA